MIWSPLNRKASNPIIKERNSISRSSMRVNRSELNGIPSSQALSRIKYQSETTDISSIKDLSNQGYPGLLHRASADLPKKFFLKATQIPRQDLINSSLKSTEFSQEVPAMFNPYPAVISKTKGQIEKRFATPGQVSRLIFPKNLKSSFKLQTEESDKSFGKDNSKEGSPSKTSTRSKQQRSMSPLIQKRIQEELFKEASKANDASKKAKSTMLDIKLLMKRSLRHLPNSKRKPFMQQFAQNEEPPKKDTAEYCTKQMDVKERVANSKDIKVYLRHRDVITHIERSTSDAGISNLVMLRNNSIQKKIIEPSEFKTNKDSSPEAESSLLKNLNVGGKRDSDLSILSFSGQKETKVRNDKKRMPPVLLNKSNVGRSHDLISNSIEENKRFLVTNLLNNSGDSLHESISKIKNIKGSSVLNIYNTQVNQEQQVQTIDLKKVMENEPQESKAFKKLETYFKGNPQQNSEKRANQEDEGRLIEKKNIRQHSILKGPSSNPGTIFRGFPQETEELQNKIVFLGKKWNEYASSKDKKSLSLDEPAPTEILSENQMQEIRNEYKKRVANPQLVNYDKLDMIVSKLEFFSKLSKSMRIALLQKSHLVYYISGSNILKKEDCVDQMYVILRGSVNIRTTKILANKRKESVNVAVLTTGQHFGDYTLVKAQQEVNKLQENKYRHVGTLDLELEEQLSPTKKQAEASANRKSYIGSLGHMIEEWERYRSHSPEKKPEEQLNQTTIIEVIDSCDLLSVPRHPFQIIFLDLIEKELGSKLKTLICLPFFQEMDPFKLIPLANQLVSKVYKLREVIVSIGENVKKLGIVSEGRCKIVPESPPSDQEVSNKYSQKKTLKTLATVAAEIKLESSRERAKTNVKLNPESQIEKEYKTKNGKRDSVGHKLCGVLVRGNVFGERTLFADEEMIEENAKFGEDYYQGPARLSVIADSPLVEIFELSKESISLVPDYLMDIMKTFLKHAKQFDDLDSEANEQFSKIQNDYGTKMIPRKSTSKSPEKTG